MTDPTIQNATAGSTTYAYDVPEPAQPTSDQQIAETASEILDTGDRAIFADDYDARVVRFAEEMADLSPEDGARLVQEVLRQDTGALQSWMKLDIVDRMQNEGRMSQPQFEAIAQGLVEAYNSGGITQAQAETFLQVSSLQDRAPGHVADQFAQMRELLAAAGTSDAASTFRETFAEQLLARSLGDGAAWAVHAPGLAMQIASDSGDPTMASRVFNDVLEANGGSEDTRGTLLDAIGQSSIGFRNSQAGVDGLVNPLSTLIDSIATQPNTQQWNDIAVGVGRYAESSSDDVFFDFYNDDKPFADTAQSLSTLLASPHGDAILTDLTVWDSTGVSGAGGHAQQYGQNAIDLGNVLRITAFNPDNPGADAAMTAVSDWAQVRQDFLANVDGSYPPGMDVSTARQQLGMLGGAAFDAVRTMQIDAENREAATQALVGFAVDVGLTLVPGGGKISELVAGDLKTTFGNNPRIDALIDEALGQGDTLTSSQIDALKEGIAGALSDSETDIEALRTTAGSFVANSVLAGVSGGDPSNPGAAHRDVIASHIQVVQTEIQDNRGS